MLTFCAVKLVNRDSPGVPRWPQGIAVACCGILHGRALFRALRLEDVQPAVYRVTVRWFLAAVAVMVAGVLLAAFELALA